MSQAKEQKSENSLLNGGDAMLELDDETLDSGAVG